MRNLCTKDPWRQNEKDVVLIGWRVIFFQPAAHMDSGIRSQRYLLHDTFYFRRLTCTDTGYCFSGSQIWIDRYREDNKL